MDSDIYMDHGTEGNELLSDDEDHSDVEIQVEIMNSDEDTDGMEDNDFSSDDEEFIEGRKKMKERKLNTIGSVMSTIHVGLDANDSSSALMSHGLQNESDGAST